MQTTSSVKEGILNLMDLVEDSCAEEYKFAGKQPLQIDTAFPVHQNTIYRKREISLLRELTADKFEIIGRVDRLLRRRKAEKTEPLFFDHETNLQTPPVHSRDTVDSITSRARHLCFEEPVQMKEPGSNGEAAAEKPEQLRAARNFIRAHRIAMHKRRSRSDQLTYADYQTRLDQAKKDNNNKAGLIEFKTGAGTEMTVENSIENQITLALARDRDLSPLMTYMKIRDMKIYFKKLNLKRKQQRAVDKSRKLKLIDQEADDSSGEEELPIELNASQALTNLKHGDNSRDPNKDASDSDFDSEEEAFQKKADQKLDLIRTYREKKTVKITNLIVTDRDREELLELEKKKKHMPSFQILQVSKLDNQHMEADSCTIHSLMRPPTPTNNLRAKKMIALSEDFKNSLLAGGNQDRRPNGFLLQSKRKQFSPSKTTRPFSLFDRKDRGAALFSSYGNPVSPVTHHMTRKANHAKESKVQQFEKYKHLLDQSTVHNEHLRNIDSNKNPNRNPFFYENLIDYPQEFKSIMIEQSLLKKIRNNPKQSDAKKDSAPKRENKAKMKTVYDDIVSLDSLLYKIEKDKPSVQSFVGNRSEHNYNSYKRQRNGPKVDETQLASIMSTISRRRQDKVVALSRAARQQQETEKLKNKLLCIWTPGNEK